MTELYDTTYSPKAAIIDGLLYAGAYLFVGAPKIGKFFFMAQLSYHVATGTSLWQYDVHPGEVLYLALEDDYARIQLEAFLAHHPETRMMIVDTLQKIREIGSDKYNYSPSSPPVRRRSYTFLGCRANGRSVLTDRFAAAWATVRQRLCFKAIFY